MGKIIAICNQKGGTGKTTSAINLASYLALANKKVLLLDFDPQANATSGLGIEKLKLSSSIYDVLLEKLPLEKIILPTKISRLFLAPSNLNLTGAEVELVTMEKREYCLKKALGETEKDFDFIFIDCPPSLGLLTINALCAARSVFIPVQCEYYALEGLSLLLETIRMVKENLNASLEIEGVLMTMADYRTNLAKEVINETRAFFKEKVYQTVIPRSIRLAEAPSFGKPVVFYNRDSIGAQKYQDLSQELLKEPDADLKDTIKPDVFKVALTERPDSAIAETGSEKNEV